MRAARIKIDRSLEKLFVSTSDAEGDDRHPYAFFSLITEGPDQAWQSLLAEGEQIGGTNREGSFSRFVQTDRDGGQKGRLEEQRFGKVRETSIHATHSHTNS